MFKQTSRRGTHESNFPIGNYTPYGYLHTPKHTGLNPTGIVRSVPPLGFGVWTGGLHGYGMNQMRHINNYVCMVLPSVRVNDVLLADLSDFDMKNIAIVSKYHSSRVMSYDIEIDGVRFSFIWFRINEDALALKVMVYGDVKASVQVDLHLKYGMNGSTWWGSDAVTMRCESSGLIGKILAYGDIFCLKADIAPSVGVTAQTDEDIRHWQEGKIRLGPGPCSTRLPDPVSGLLGYAHDLEEGEEYCFHVLLTRGVNERTARKIFKETIDAAPSVLAARVAEDKAFYQNAPILEGDWPESWKRGWVIDFETLRMNIMDPIGIYHHHWDGMQALNPRVVVGETAIDMLTLGYADINTALEIIEGMFADAQEVYVPCSREDGSVNMIGEDGSECATAPIWGMPMRAIRILLARSGNISWLTRLYPRLKAYVLWWRDNRTDAQGWYHCNNSWESGQDGSIRFITSDNRGTSIKEAANAERVRTADLEAAMAAAMEDMAHFAQLIHQDDDVEFWQSQAQAGRLRVDSMFVDNCYRDFDATTGEPIMTAEHHDIMLTMPVALGLSSDEQKRKMQWLFDMYEKRMDTCDFGQGYAPYWPPILQTLTEELYHMGDQQRTANMLSRLLNDAWERNDSRRHQPGPKMPGIPEKYCMRIPGIARENLSKDWDLAGCENYGWGCLGPALLIENILGLRPEDAYGQSFSLNPALPDFFSDGVYSVINLRHNAFRFDVHMQKSHDGLSVSIVFHDSPEPVVRVNNQTKQMPDTFTGIRADEKIVIA